MEEVPAVEKEILDFIDARKIELQNPPPSAPPLTGGLQTKYITEEEIRAFSRNPDRDIRRRASESLQSVYLVHQNQITF